LQGIILNHAAVKRIIALLLFCSLAFPFMGTYGWLLLSKHLLKREIRQQILSGMAREHLVLLSFSSSDASRELRWEHSGEFAWQGNMYDIVEQTITEDSCIFLCYPDHRESALNREIASLVETCLGHSPIQKENQQQLNRWLQMTYLFTVLHWHPQAPKTPPQQTFMIYLSCLAGIHDPPDHPPKS